MCINVRELNETLVAWSLVAYVLLLVCSKDPVKVE
jgi:hypothetical protein